jgi:hypothetical protein
MKIPVSRYIFLSASLLFPTIAAKAQSFKNVDLFRFNLYYTAFINGSGTVTDTLTGTPSSRTMLIRYHFDHNQNTYFTINRNYGTSTQDYSFMPSGFSVKIKGGTGTDKIQLRLWEDLNRNGIFDEKDEVYASNAFMLPGDTTWHTLFFPIRKFRCISGNGNRKLDLKRIRSWEFSVENTSANAHRAELSLRDFRFISHHKPVKENKAAVTGTFIMLTESGNNANAFWTQLQWDNEFLRMKERKINRVVVQYSIYYNSVWYSPCHVQGNNTCKTALNNLFKAAENTGIKVFTGLSFSPDWNIINKSQPALYDGLLKQHEQNIDELAQLFGSSPAFGGWYIPQEINDLEWQGSNRTLLFNWLRDVSAYAHAKAPGKPVMIAPFFNLWQPADELARWYDEMLKVAKDIDEIYPQDGVGTTQKNATIDTPHYFPYLKEVCRRHKRKFGITVEAFRQLTGWPVNNDKFSAMPADAETFRTQLNEAGQLKPDGIISYEWNYLNGIK